MSGLNVENFNLFAKKPTTKPAQKPIVTPATSKEVVEEEIAKFDAEIETTKEIVKSAPVIEPMVTKAQEPEIQIERFEEMRTTPVMNTMTETKLVNKEVKSLEVTLKAAEKNLSEAPMRKFETFVAPTFRIPEEHDFELKKIETFIMRNRKKGVNIDCRERITANTVVRAIIANFLERAGDLDLSNIDNEEMLKERLEKVFKQKYTKRA